MDLIYCATGAGCALSGLGPLVEGYSVVASLSHTRSTADAANGDAPEFPTFIENIRGKLIHEFGSCLMTEHGRIPVCTDSMAADRHCYHAHVLLFPGAPPIADAAIQYFDTMKNEHDFRTALRIANKFDEYFLLSPNPQEYFVFRNERKLPRQFARTLVAASLGKAPEAAWQAFPRREAAVASAFRLRRIFTSQV